MRRFLYLFVLLPFLFLTGCGGTLSISLYTTDTPAPAPALTMQPPKTQVATLQNLRGLDLTSDSETIRRALLNSHHNWQNLWLDAQIINNLPGGEQHAEHDQIWVDQINTRFRVLTGPLDGNPQTLEVADGDSVGRFNLVDQTGYAGDIPPSARNFSWQAPTDISDNIIPYPLDGAIDSPISEIVFPAALAQRRGIYTPTGMEKVAGQMALVVEFSDSTTIRDRFWIDASRGIILRRDSYGKGDNSNTPEQTMITLNIAYDPPLPKSLFDLNLPQKPPFVLNVEGQTNPTPVPPEPVFKPGEGQLYFVMDRTPEDLQLVRLPGGCVLGKDECPVPQPVAGYPNRNNSVTPLIWSPGGSLATLTHLGSLYLYNPESGEWKVLAQAPILSEQVVWSQDGQWLAYVSTQTDGAQDVIAARADGSFIQNETSGRFSGPDTALAVDGFLSNGRLLFEVIQKTSVQIYTVRPGESPDVQPIDGLTMEHGVLAISPDGQQIAYSTIMDGSAIIQTAGLDLKTDSNGLAGKVELMGKQHRIATIQEGVVQQILWGTVERADKSRTEKIAYLASSGSSPEDFHSTVVVVNPDGTDMRTVFQQPAIQRLTFADQGRYLISVLAENGRLYAIPVEDGKPRAIDAPRLETGQRLLGASWRK